MIPGKRRWHFDARFGPHRWVVKTTLFLYPQIHLDFECVASISETSLQAVRRISTNPSSFSAAGNGGPSGIYTHNTWPFLIGPQPATASEDKTLHSSEAHKHHHVFFQWRRHFGFAIAHPCTSYGRHVSREESPTFHIQITIQVSVKNKLTELRQFTTSFTTITVSTIRGNTSKAAHRTIATTDGPSGCHVRTRHLPSPIIHFDTSPTECSTVSALRKVRKNVNKLVPTVGAREGFAEKSPQTSAQRNSRFW